MANSILNVQRHVLSVGEADARKTHLQNLQNLLVGLLLYCDYGVISSRIARLYVVMLQSDLQNLFGRRMDFMAYRGYTMQQVSLCLDFLAKLFAPLLWSYPKDQPDGWHGAWEHEP